MRDYNPTPVIFTESVKAELLTNVEFFDEQQKIWYQRWELPDGEGKILAFEDEMREARWDKNNVCDSLMALALALWSLFGEIILLWLQKLDEFKNTFLKTN